MFGRCGNYNHEWVNAPLAKALQQLEAIAIGKSNVEQHEIDWHLRSKVTGFFGGSQGSGDNEIAIARHHTH
jgi:hypothetical protein